LKLAINNKKQKIFLLKEHSIDFIVNSKIELILSPEFYWIRYFEAPAISEAEAKKLVKSFFEDVVPDGIEYTYYTIKLKDKGYLYFAYDKEKIISHLKVSGIDVGLINNVYFAHNECLEYKSFIYEGVGFKYVNNILVKVPASMIDDQFVDIKNEIDSFKLSKHILKLKFYENIISTRTLRVMFTFLILLTILIFWKNNTITNKIEINNMKAMTTKKSSSLPESMIQTNSIVKELKAKVLKQQKIRNVMGYFLSYKKIQKTFMIENIVYQDNTITFNLKGIDNQKFKNYFDNTVYDFTIKKINETTVLEVKI
jgi:hypothetical protein